MYSKFKIKNIFMSLLNLNNKQVEVTDNVLTFKL